MSDLPLTTLAAVLAVIAIAGLIIVALGVLVGRTTGQARATAAVVAHAHGLAATLATDLAVAAERAASTRTALMRYEVGAQQESAAQTEAVLLSNALASAVHVQLRLRVLRAAAFRRATELYPADLMDAATRLDVLAHSNQELAEVRSLANADTARAWAAGDLDALAAPAASAALDEVTRVSVLRLAPAVRELIAGMDATGALAAGPIPHEWPPAAPLVRELRLLAEWTRSQLPNQLDVPVRAALLWAAVLFGDPIASELLGAVEQ